ncbi:MAG: foldase protein PrsA, partial [Ferruginibacter sp.]
KNKTPVLDKEKAYREYLDLYTKFKLKVKAARELRLDTLPQLQYDLQSFRSQVEEGYLNDEKRVNDLVDEALERSRKDIHVLHYSVAINAKMSKADSIKAVGAINEVIALLNKAGNTNIDIVDIEEKVTKKFTTVKGDDIGFITTLSVSYDIENILYTLPVGGVSKPFRTKSALHVFKNLGERPSPGKWKVAQILVTLPPNASNETVQSLEKKADSIYHLLLNGESFAELAKKYSDDKLTFMTGGEMPEFGTGKFDMAFENKVFELKKDGDISKPIFTGYGFHIVKRLQQKPIPTDKSDEAFLFQLRQQINQDSRINTAKTLFLKEVKVKTGFKRNASVKDTELFKYADSVVVNGEIGKQPFNNKTIFSFTKLAVKGSDWLHFVKDYKLNTDVYKGESNEALLEKYISTTAMEYYRNHLELYNADFGYQMQEFKEGNMLFEIMDRNVWTKASNDSVGLKQYYDKHKTKYTWGESAAVLLFNCNSEKTALDATRMLNEGKSWQQIAEESEGRIQSDSGRYEITQLQIPAGKTLAEGVITAPLVNTPDNTASFLKVIKLYPANQQRSYEEARGLVINEYQNYLEEQWIEVLKKKYPIKINEAEFKKLLLEK